MGECDDADEIGNMEITEKRHLKGMENLYISAVTLTVKVLEVESIVIQSILYYYA